MEIRSICLAAAAALVGGCGGASREGGAGEITSSNQKSIPKVDPDLCDTSGKQVQTFDLNRDGTPDVWKLYATVEENGTRHDILTCKQVDYDHDGKKDYVAIYNKTGEIVAEEFDFTFDGRFDAREHYDKKTGKVYMVERDLDHNKNPDTWEKYDPDGNLESVERDRNGDGKPDLWEQYQHGVLLAILYDDDYDGKVDRRESARAAVALPRTPGSPAAGGPPAGAAPEGPPPGPAPGGSPASSAPAATGAPPVESQRPRGEGLVEETPVAPGQKPPAPATGQPQPPAPKKSGGK